MYRNHKIVAIAPAYNEKGKIGRVVERITGDLVDLRLVIDNGSDAPGTILEDCSGGFRNRFRDADLVIAKGQGNYETLSEVDRDVFFMLKVKCPVIAGDIGCEVGELVLRRREPSAPAGKEDGG